MGATHRDMDVLIANTYSKAVLRAAAEEITARYDFVEYYPSFESVTLSRRDLAWLDDQIHVSGDLVNLNIERMIAAYVDADGETDSSSPDGDKPALIEAISYGRVPAQKVIDFLGAQPSLIDENAELRAAYCEACLDRGKVELAGKVVRKFPQGWNPVRVALLRARWKLASGDPEEAATISRQCLRLNLGKIDAFGFLNVLLCAVIASKGATRAVQVIDQWNAKRRVITQAEPYRLVAVALAGEGRHTEADAMFAKMMRSGEGPSEKGLIDYADFLIERGRTKEAEDVLERVDDKDPATLRRIALMGLSLMNKGAADGTT